VLLCGRYISSHMPRPLGDMPPYNDINMTYMTSDERGLRGLGFPRRKGKADSIVCHLNEFNLEFSFDFLGPSLAEAYPPPTAQHHPQLPLSISAHFPSTTPFVGLCNCFCFCSAFVWPLSQSCANFSLHIVCRLLKLLLNLHKHIYIWPCLYILHGVSVCVD